MAQKLELENYERRAVKKSIPPVFPPPLPVIVKTHIC